jgi:hypothetical protein
MELIIDTKTIDIYSKQQVFYNFSGFVLIDSEIIEYEAIGYDITLQNGTKEHQWIYSESDVNKYRSLSKPGYEDVNNPANTSYVPNELVQGSYSAPTSYYYWVFDGDSQYNGVTQSANIVGALWNDWNA